MQLTHVFFTVVNISPLPQILDDDVSKSIEINTHSFCSRCLVDIISAERKTLIIRFLPDTVTLNGIALRVCDSSLVIRFNVCTNTSADRRRARAVLQVTQPTKRVCKWFVIISCPAVVRRACYDHFPVNQYVRTNVSLRVSNCFVCAHDLWSGSNG
jgi:hypothetical protein